MQIKIDRRCMLTGLLLCLLVLGAVFEHTGLSPEHSLLKAALASQAADHGGTANPSSMKSVIYDWFDRLEFREAFPAASFFQGGLSRGTRAKNGFSDLGLLPLTMAAWLFCYIKASEVINLEPACSRIISHLHKKDGMK